MSSRATVGFCRGRGRTLSSVTGQTISSRSERRVRPWDRSRLAHLAVPSFSWPLNSQFITLPGFSQSSPGTQWWQRPHLSRSGPRRNLAWPDLGKRSLFDPRSAPQEGPTTPLQLPTMAQTQDHGNGHSAMPVQSTARHPDGSTTSWSALDGISRELSVSAPARVRAQR